MPYDTNEFRIEVLLSFQRALWDQVIPELRGVAVSPGGPIIKARFIFEKLSEVSAEIVAEVEGYVVGDFRPPVDVWFSEVELPVDMRRELQDGEFWVYRRREQDPDDV